MLCMHTRRRKCWPRIWTALEARWEEVRSRNSDGSVRTNDRPDRWTGRKPLAFTGRRIRKIEVIRKGSIMSQTPNEYQ